MTHSNNKGDTILHAFLSSGSFHYDTLEFVLTMLQSSDSKIIEKTNKQGKSCFEEILKQGYFKAIPILLSYSPSSLLCEKALDLVLDKTWKQVLVDYIEVGLFF